MREELRCALDGAEMNAIDPRVYIQDIREEIGMASETLGRPGYGRTLAGKAGHEWLTVTIEFMIKERDRAARTQVISAVNGWAKTGWLTLSTRPEQRLRVTCTQPAGCGAGIWSEDLQLVFTAFDDAYWQEIYPISAALAGKEATADIRPRGTRPCPLEADVTNAAASEVNAVRLSANGLSMAFTGLALAAGETLRIFHDARGLLHAEQGGAGVLGCRTADSADDLKLYPGQSNTVAFAADGVCSVTLHARGRYD